MKLQFTIIDALAGRGKLGEASSADDAPQCRSCHDDCGKYYSTWYPTGYKYNGRRPVPLCGTCVEFLEKWRDRLQVVLPHAQWGQVVILPKPCDLIRDMMRTDDEKAAEKYRKEREEQA